MSFAVKIVALSIFQPWSSLNPNTGESILSVSVLYFLCCIIFLWCFCLFAFSVGLAIILIEFTMNISYFTVEIGQDLSGLFLSFVAALVPTALLIAETYLLAKTKFELYALDEINARVDK